MSRKVWIPLFVLVLSLLWSLPTAADGPDPNTCLPSCYAYNRAPQGGSGTQWSPWYWDKGADQAASDLRELVGAAVKGRRNSGTLEVIDCTADLTNCTATVYTYTRSGNETSESIGPVPVPDVGVSVPFHYLLGGGAFLGALLVIAGIVLVRRARR